MRLLRDGTNHYAIEVNRGRVWTTLVLHKSGGKRITVKDVKVKNGEVDKNWREVKDYPIDKAVERFLNPKLSVIGVGERVRELLTGEKEPQMYIINTDQPKLIGRFSKTAGKPVLKQCQETGTCIGVVEQAELKGMSIAALTALFNSVVPEENRIKKFSDKTVAAKKLWEALEAMEDKAPKVTRAVTPRAESKFSKLRDALMTKKKFTRDQLMEISGFDKPNLSTALAILGNPKRQKSPLTISKTDDGKVFLAA